MGCSHHTRVLHARCPFVRVETGLLLSLGAASLLLADTNLLFHAAFDDPAGIERAVVAAGSRQGEIVGEVTAAPGFQGQSVVVGGRGSLLFDGQRNLDAGTGAVAFWFAPLNWDAATNVTVILMRLTLRDDNVAWLSREHDRGTTGNCLSVQLYGPQPDGRMGWGGGVRGRHHSAASIRRGQWNHFLATWDRTRMRVYLNGETEQAGGSRKAFRQPDRFSIGPGRLSAGQPDTRIDEVKIFARFFDAGDVRELIRRETSGIDEDQRF